jgi:hypothetical protein
MKLFLATILGALAFVGASVVTPEANASQSPTTALGNLNISRSGAGYYVTLDSDAVQTNAWEFSVTVPANCPAYGFNLVTAVPVVFGTSALDSLTTSIYKAVGGVKSGAPLVITNVLNSFLPSGYVTQFLEFTGLLSGNYILETVATGVKGYAFSGTVSINQVWCPLPAALPLFGSALLGLGGLRWRRSRQESSAALA